MLDTFSIFATYVLNSRYQAKNVLDDNECAVFNATLK